MTLRNCELQIDFERGVIYVHAPDGHTILRICGCKQTKEPTDSDTRLFDITLKGQQLAPYTFNW